MSARVVIVMLALLMLMPLSCVAKPLHTSRLQLARENPFIAVTVIDCHDGDTCTMILPDQHPLFGFHIPVRLAGIDAPERHAHCPREKALAEQARALTRDILAHATRIDLVDPQRDKYFRILAHVVADGQDVSALLLARGLAMRYEGGMKVSWC